MATEIEQCVERLEESLNKHFDAMNMIKDMVDASKKGIKIIGVLGGVSSFLVWARAREVSRLNKNVAIGANGWIGIRLADVKVLGGQPLNEIVLLRDYASVRNWQDVLKFAQAHMGDGWSDIHQYCHDRFKRTLSSEQVGLWQKILAMAFDAAQQLGLKR